MLFTAETQQVYVSVRPIYRQDYSVPRENYYVWTYEVRITNNSYETLKLLRRHWLIEDSNGAKHEIEGEGVVGKQPSISPGKVFAYQSFTVLNSMRGEMWGSYRMVNREGVAKEIRIPRFQLEYPVRLVSVNSSVEKM